MGKITTTIRLEQELHRFLKENGIGLSSFIGSAIRERMRSQRTHLEDEIKRTKKTLVLLEERLDNFEEHEGEAVDPGATDMAGLKMLVKKGISTPRASEDKMEAWIAGNKKNIEEYGGTVPMFRKMVVKAHKKKYGEDFWSED